MTISNMDISLNTIGYLMNPAHKHVLNQTNDSEAKQFRGELRFYKKRILQATRDLVKGAHIGREIDSSFLSYCRTLIQHFRAVDERDIMQEAYVGMSVQDNDGSSPIDAAAGYATADSFIMRSKKKKERIDEYLDIKKHSNKPKPILPHQRHVDLHTPELRTKGVRRKKNLTSTYDEDT